MTDRICKPASCELTRSAPALQPQPAHDRPHSHSHHDDPTSGRSRHLSHARAERRQLSQCSACRHGQSRSLSVGVGRLVVVSVSVSSSQSTSRLCDCAVSCGGVAGMLCQSGIRVQLSAGYDCFKGRRRGSRITSSGHNTHTRERAKDTHRRMGSRGVCCVSHGSLLDDSCASWSDDKAAFVPSLRVSCFLAHLYVCGCVRVLSLPSLLTPAPRATARRRTTPSSLARAARWRQSEARRP